MPRATASTGMARASSSKACRTSASPEWASRLPDAPRDEHEMKMPRTTDATQRLAIAAQHPGIDAWFESQGWTPFDFQREVWIAMEQGQNGLLHATTGSGKTYAVWMGALLHSMRQG